MEQKNKVNLNSVIKIDADVNTNFFEYWLKFIKPLHNLSERDMTIAAEFLKKRFELEQTTSDPRMLDEFTFCTSNRKEIREKYNMSVSNFQVVLAHLRNLGFLNGNKINPKFIPRRLNRDDKSYQLLIYFDLNSKDNEEDNNR